MPPAVLAYHKVGTPELGGTWCTRRQLRSHLTALASAGWRAIDAATFEQRLDDPEPPRREALVTFDDAFASFGAAAWPELERARVPVLLFVVTDYVGRRATWDWPLPGRRVPHLDWPALRRLVRAGVGIGSHAATHRDLRRLADAELHAELRRSRLRLEDELGIGVRSIAYPFGRCDARVVAAAAATGYAFGFAMSAANAGQRLALPRSGVYVIDSPGAVLDKIDPRRRGHAWQKATGRGISACATLVTALPPWRG